MQQLFEPKHWSAFLEPSIWRFLGEGLRLTVSMAAIAMVCSLIFGLVLALLRLSRFGALHDPAAVFVDVVRALPVLFLIFFTWVAASRAKLGLSLFGQGTLALTVYTAAVNAEIIRAGIQGIRRGQGGKRREASRFGGNG